MKKTVLIIVVCLLVAALLCAAFPFAYYGIHGGQGFYNLIHRKMTADKLPEPDTIYHEFQIRLTYEINGEEKVIEDSLICEYDGLGWANKFTETYYKWKETFKSGNKRIILLNIDEKNILHIVMRENWHYSDEYSKESWIKLHTEREIDVFRNDIDADAYFGSYYGEYVDAEELLNKYGIKIISFEMAYVE